jgi:hypothetical protein
MGEQRRRRGIEAVDFGRAIPHSEFRIPPPRTAETTVTTAPRMRFAGRSQAFHRNASTLLLQRSLHATQCGLSLTQCGLSMTQCGLQMTKMRLSDDRWGLSDE